MCASNWLLWHSVFTKFYFGRGFTLDPPWEVYNALTDPIVVVERYLNRS